MTRKFQSSQDQFQLLVAFIGQNLNHCNAIVALQTYLMCFWRAMNDNHFEYQHRTFVAVIIMINV